MSLRPRSPLPPITTTQERIGQRITRLRKQRGLTQAELADIIGVPRTAVADYEREKAHLYDEMVARFAVALRVSADELLGLTSSDHVETTPSVRVMKRVHRIEQLNATKKKTLLSTIDAFLKANETP